MYYRVFLLAMHVMLLTGCDPQEPAVIRDEEGTILFRLAEDCGAGNLLVYIDGESVGTIGTYWKDGGPFCGEAKRPGALIPELAAGTYRLDIVAEGNGARWTDDLVVEAGICSTYPISCALFVAGGGNSRPRERIVFQRNKDCSTGWEEYYIDDRLIKRNDSYWPNGGPYCSTPPNEYIIAGEVNPGVHNLRIVSEAGGDWTDQITVGNGECLEYHVNCDMLKNSAGTGGSGGGGTDPSADHCDWGAGVNSIMIIKSGSVRSCTSFFSAYATFQNQSGVWYKLTICVQKTDGSWISFQDDTGDKGFGPGATMTVQSCNAKGRYEIHATRLSDYLKNNCALPETASCG